MPKKQESLSAAILYKVHFLDTLYFIMIPVQLCGHNATWTLVYVSKKLAKFHWRCSDSRQLYAHFFRRLIALSLPVAFPALKAGFFSKNFWCEREMAEDVNDDDDLRSLMLLCWTTMNFALDSCQKFLPFFMLSFRNKVMWLRKKLVYKK